MTRQHANSRTICPTDVLMVIFFPPIGLFKIDILKKNNDLEFSLLGI